VSEKGAIRARIREIAAPQQGHVTRQQLLRLGLSASWIRDQVRLGWLIPVHAGVYAVGHIPQHAHARAMAAVLACGDGAALSHWAAAALWDVADWPATLEVSAPRNRCRPGLLTHRSRTLGGHDVRIRHGVPVTSPVRTALDLQSRLTDQRLIRLVNDLRMAGHIRATAFTELRRRSARIDALLGDAGASESELEDLFGRFVARHRLPMPEVSVEMRIGGRIRRLDAFYREARLIIELDSWRYHSDRATFERDRAKDAAALAEGFRTLRSTDRRLRGDGRHEAALIRRILAGGSDFGLK
jgi:very-short-patch-repair endonuclease